MKNECVNECQFKEMLFKAMLHVNAFGNVFEEFLCFC